MGANIREEGSENIPQKKIVKGVAQLILAVGITWAMTFVVLPMLTNSCSNIKTLANFIDYSEIDTGQFYYTDVEIVSHADISARSTIEYFSRKRDSGL